MDSLQLKKLQSLKIQFSYKPKGVYIPWNDLPWNDLPWNDLPWNDLTPSNKKTLLEGVRRIMKRRGQWVKGMTGNDAVKRLNLLNKEVRWQGRNVKCMITDMDMIFSRHNNATGSKLAPGPTISSMKRGKVTRNSAMRIGTMECDVMLAAGLPRTLQAIWDSTAIECSVCLKCRREHSYCCCGSVCAKTLESASSSTSRLTKSNGGIQDETTVEIVSIPSVLAQIEAVVHIGPVGSFQYE
eukprot:GHVR01024245.1.p2 GENE.GHVR01024245.1~~GHVR01024245.1.p2  ORF type:complete len:240 (+),score=21.02 GHVR01024245.1:132-851(+)